MQVGDPQWTARAEESEGAQDPLGMNRVLDRLLGDLLPGITTISPRPRYIAHHLWALRDVTQRDDPESRAQLMRGLYQRERILLLAGVRHQGSDSPKSHTNFVGARTAHRLLGEDVESISLDFSFSSSRSGSYGQNYVGPLQAMGLVDTPEDARLEQVTDRGEPLADAYAHIAEQTNLPELAAGDTISIAELDAIAADLCPCAVSEPEAPDQDPLRTLYIDRDPPEAYAAQARTRRESLALVLHTARTGGETTTLTPSNLLDACYYGTIIADGTPLEAEVPPGLAETAACWKALQAHDYFRYATESALKAWLAYLKETDEADVTLEAFKQQARAAAVCDRMTALLDSDFDLGPTTPLRSLVSAMWPDATAGQLVAREPISPVPMTHAASEHTLDATLRTALSGRDWIDVYAAWPLLLIALALRYAAPSGPDGEAWTWLSSRTQDDLSPVRFNSHLRAHIEDEISVGEFIDWVIDRYIIERGVEIAAGKGGSGGSRGYFEQTGAGWRHVREHSPGHWGARFGSAVSVLRDLALLDPDSSTEEVTAAGKTLLESEGEMK
jgi:hypothetical protein